MKLTRFERQTLTGPAVVGCVLGSLVGFVTLAFDSDYGNLTRWGVALDVVTSFLATVAIAMVPLWLLPIAIHRLRGLKRGGQDDRER